MSEPDGYYYPYEDDVELEKGWQLGQKALFIASSAVAHDDVIKAKHLAEEALRFLQPHTDMTSQYYNDNIALINEFGRVLIFLKDINADTQRFSAEFKHYLHVTSVAVLNAFENIHLLQPGSFFYKEKGSYNPFTVTVRSNKKKGNRRRNKQKEIDWRDGSWIGKWDDQGKAIYFLKGNDQIERHFNEENVEVELGSDYEWHIRLPIQELDEVGPRYHSEQLYADDAVRWNYGLPAYNDKQKTHISQWVLKQQEEAARIARGELSYFDAVAARQQVAAQHQAGPSSWHAGPSSWQAYPRQAWGRYKSRRVKIPRQRRKTNRKNRKNKTIRKK